MAIDWYKLLSGGDLRSIGNNRSLEARVTDKKEFGRLFRVLNSGNRLQVMRSADLIEKITVKQPNYLQGYETELMKLAENATEKELKWHLARLVTRIALTSEFGRGLWNLLKEWARDRSESRIVRVEAVQALWQLSDTSTQRRREVKQLVRNIEIENIPSLNARIRKLGLSM